MGVLLIVLKSIFKMLLEFRIFEFTPKLYKLGTLQRAIL